MPAIYGVSTTPAANQIVMCGTLAGLDYQTALGILNRAIKAYADYRMGDSTASASYAQGDGSRSVTKRTVSGEGLREFIRELRRDLGLPYEARRPLRPYYR